MQMPFTALIFAKSGLVCMFICLKVALCCYCVTACDFNFNVQGNVDLALSRIAKTEKEMNLHTPYITGNVSTLQRLSSKVKDY